ncbi:hypothetical protein DIPPA_29431 [Diplonema papillatum]|nr:hypothetical protein DIPPA_29431 [Diplonema papillatum]
MPGLSLGELGLSDLAKAIGPTRSAAERVAGFKSLRSVFEADPKALCREGADAALQAARDAVEAGVKPWLGRALKLLCCAVTCDGASLLSWGERTAIAKCLRAAMHHADSDVVGAAALILSSPSLRGGPPGTCQQSQEAFDETVKSLASVAFPPSPAAAHKQHFRAACLGVAAVLSDVRSLARTRASAHVWLPWVMDALGYEPSPVFTGGGGSADRAQTDGSEGLWGLVAAVKALLPCLPGVPGPTGASAVTGVVVDAAKRHRAWMHRVLKTPQDSRSRLDRALALWELQVRFDGRLRDRGCKVAGEVNQLLEAISPVLQRAADRSAGLRAWRGLIHAWSSDTAFRTGRQAAFLLVPLSAGGKPPRADHSPQCAARPPAAFAAARDDCAARAFLLRAAARPGVDDEFLKAVADGHLATVLPVTATERAKPAYPGCLVIHSALAALQACGGGLDSSQGRTTETPHAHGSTADVTVNKPACPKQAFGVNDKAWNNQGSILSTAAEPPCVIELLEAGDRNEQWDGTTALDPCFPHDDPEHPAAAPASPSVVGFIARRLAARLTQTVTAPPDTPGAEPRFIEASAAWWLLCQLLRLSGADPPADAERGTEHAQAVQSSTAELAHAVGTLLTSGLIAYCMRVRPLGVLTVLESFAPVSRAVLPVHLNAPGRLGVTYARALFEEAVGSMTSAAVYARLAADGQGALAGAVLLKAVHAAVFGAFDGPGRAKPTAALANLLWAAAKLVRTVRERVQGASPGGNGGLLDLWRHLCGALEGVVAASGVAGASGHHPLDSPPSDTAVAVSCMLGKPRTWDPLLDLSIAAPVVLLSVAHGGFPLSEQALSDVASSLSGVVACLDEAQAAVKRQHQPGSPPAASCIAADKKLLAFERNLFSAARPALALAQVLAGGHVAKELLPKVSGLLLRLAGPATAVPELEPELAAGHRSMAGAARGCRRAVKSSLAAVLGRTVSAALAQLVLEDPPLPGAEPVLRLLRAAFVGERPPAGAAAAWPARWGLQDPPAEGGGGASGLDGGEEKFVAILAGVGEAAAPLCDLLLRLKAQARVEPAAGGLAIRIDEVLSDVCKAVEHCGFVAAWCARVEEAAGGAAAPPRRLPVGAAGASLHALLTEWGPDQRCKVQLAVLLLAPLVVGMLRCSSHHLASRALRLWEATVGKLTDRQAAGLVYPADLYDGIVSAAKVMPSVRLPGVSSSELLEDSSVPPLHLPDETQAACSTPPMPTGASAAARVGLQGLKRTPGPVSGAAVSLPPPSPLRKQLAPAAFAPGPKHLSRGDAAAATPTTTTPTTSLNLMDATHQVQTTPTATTSAAAIPPPSLAPPRLAEALLLVPEAGEGPSNPAAPSMVDGSETRGGQSGGRRGPEPGAGKATEKAPVRGEAQQRAEAACAGLQAMGYGEDDMFYPPLAENAEGIYNLLGADVQVPTALWKAGSGAPCGVVSIGDLAAMPVSRAKRLLRNATAARRLLAQYHKSARPADSKAHQGKDPGEVGPDESLKKQPKPPTTATGPKTVQKDTGSAGPGEPCVALKKQLKPPATTTTTTGPKTVQKDTGTAGPSEPCAALKKQPKLPATATAEPSPSSPRQPKPNAPGDPKSPPSKSRGRAAPPRGPGRGRPSDDDEGSDGFGAAAGGKPAGKRPAKTAARLDKGTPATKRAREGRPGETSDARETRESDSVEDGASTATRGGRGGEQNGKATADSESERKQAKAMKGPGKDTDNSVRGKDAKTHKIAKSGGKTARDKDGKATADSESERKQNKAAKSLDKNTRDNVREKDGKTTADSESERKRNKAAKSLDRDTVREKDAKAADSESDRKQTKAAKSLAKDARDVREKDGKATADSESERRQTKAAECLDKDPRDNAREKDGKARSESEGRGQRKQKSASPPSAKGQRKTADPAWLGGLPAKHARRAATPCRSFVVSGESTDDSTDSDSTAEGGGSAETSTQGGSQDRSHATTASSSRTYRAAGQHPTVMTPPMNHQRDPPREDELLQSVRGCIARFLVASPVAVEDREKIALYAKVCAAASEALLAPPAAAADRRPPPRTVGATVRRDKRARSSAAAAKETPPRKRRCASAASSPCASAEPPPAQEPAAGVGASACSAAFAVLLVAAATTQQWDISNWKHRHPSCHSILPSRSATPEGKRRRRTRSVTPPANLPADREESQEV